MKQRHPVIGIFTYRKGTRFMESFVFRQWVEIGRKLGANVYVFNESDIRLRQKQIRGFKFTRSGWTAAMEPWPDIVIDRRRCNWNAAFRIMRNRSLFPYANDKFVLKSKALEMFSEDERTARWLPKTLPYSERNLRSMLAQYPLIYAKPNNGTGGMGVVRIQAKQGRYEVWGRERSFGLRNVRLRHRGEVVRWLAHWTRSQRIRNGSFVLQQGIDTELLPERTADARVLHQKNGEGEWVTTGMAIRVGTPRSPNSNLAGQRGSAALPFLPFMEKHFGTEQAKAIEEECRCLAQRLTEVIEEKIGSLFEIGIDLAVDKSGKIWLLEVNPKPSRDLFRKIGDKEAYRNALTYPIAYAMYLARKRYGKAGHKIVQIHDQHKEEKAVPEQEEKQEQQVLQVEQAQQIQQVQHVQRAQYTQYAEQLQQGQQKVQDARQVQEIQKVQETQQVELIQEVQAVQQTEQIQEVQTIEQIEKIQEAQGEIKVQQGEPQSKQQEPQRQQVQPQQEPVQEQKKTLMHEEEQERLVRVNGHNPNSEREEARPSRPFSHRSADAPAS
ncbi:YheC/YheD family protein [Paenibacillus dendritiformis]|uniref:YheC/YheD family endospore coat-associated protein n=1 Tax=Paenibacillus dendritiformis TaxID=130049 RepID=UPI0018CF8C8A|nr:YheC/YheD family protein [Paenibacillus dendritiformis]